jgi:hypothetical protein
MVFVTKPGATVCLSAAELPPRGYVSAWICGTALDCYGGGTYQLKLYLKQGLSQIYMVCSF